MTISKKTFSTLLFKGLLFTVIFYNFHRYLFKYGSSDFVDESLKEITYTISPVRWQIGKYAVISVLILAISLLSEVKKSVNWRIMSFYLVIFFLLLVALFSGMIYGVVVNSSLGITRSQAFNYDELEYIIFSIIAFPITFTSKRILLQVVKLNIDNILRFVTMVVIISNLLVVLNYFIFDVLPFHGYKGSLLIRFGGFWDDPNCFSIFSCFLLFFAANKKRYLSVFFLFVNVVMAISFTGYILLFLILFYFMIRNKRVFIKGSFFLILLIGIVVFNMEFLEVIYELKKGSLEAHGNRGFDFVFLPFQQPMVFHETWLLSFLVNYPPISYIVVAAMFIYFLKVFFLEKYSVQKSYFIIFFASSLFLPFVYMFPLNFIGIFLYILYSKGVSF